MNMQNEDRRRKRVFTKASKDFSQDVAIFAFQKVLEHEAHNKVRERHISFKNGDCYVDHRLIDFPNKKTLYFLLVQALVENAQVDGFCERKAIIDHWLKQGIEVPNGAKQRTRSIDNGIPRRSRPHTG